jgi:hypothetical protein
MAAGGLPGGAAAETGGVGLGDGGCAAADDGADFAVAATSAAGVAAAGAGGLAGGWGNDATALAEGDVGTASCGRTAGAASTGGFAGLAERALMGVVISVAILSMSGLGGADTSGDAGVGSGGTERPPATVPVSPPPGSAGETAGGAGAAGDAGATERGTDNSATSLTTGRGVNCHITQPIQATASSINPAMTHQNIWDPVRCSAAGRTWSDTGFAGPGAA